MQKMLRIAEKTVDSLRLNELINKFGLQNHKEDEGINLRRHLPRSTLYK